MGLLLQLAQLAEGGLQYTLDCFSSSVVFSVLFFSLFWNRNFVTFDTSDKLLNPSCSSWFEIRQKEFVHPKESLRQINESSLGILRSNQKTTIS